MGRVTVSDLAEIVEQLRQQVAELNQRVDALHAAPVAPPTSTAQPEAPPPSASISEEELLAISAAIGAYLGVRPHIRQIRLISTAAWAQQGRVSIQASHTLQG